MVQAGDKHFQFLAHDAAERQHWVTGLQECQQLQREALPPQQSARESELYQTLREQQPDRDAQDNHIIKETPEYTLYTQNSFVCYSSKFLKCEQYKCEGQIYFKSDNVLKQVAMKFPQTKRRIKIDFTKCVVSEENLDQIAGKFDREAKIHPFGSVIKVTKKQLNVKNRDLRAPWRYKFLLDLGPEDVR